MRKILYISGTRADYGLMRQVLFSIKKHPKLKIEIVATGMHLMSEFGRTIDEIKKDKFKIHKIKAIYEKDNKESMSVFVGKFIQLLTKDLKKIKPDIILVLGDRAEMLGAAIAGTYLTIPIAQVHGGDVTSTVDEIARHSITKLSYIHFPATKKAAERIIKMGEDPWRIFTVGAPGLDNILSEGLFSKREIAKKYKLDLSKPILLVVQHPVTGEVELAGKHMKTTMEVTKEFGYQTIIVYPNADAGGRSMIKIIEKYRKYSFIQIYKNIPRKDYLSLMKVVSVMVGNSSSGIIEAPTFHLSVINVGPRQKGREKADNLIDVGYNRREIKKAILKAIYDKRFKAKVKKCRNPYRKKGAAVKITEILNKIKINRKLLEKKITY